MNTAQPEAQDAGRWLRAAPIIAMACVVTIASQFYRNAHVVVAPDIMRELGVSAQLFGYLSGALFVAAAIAQIPAGVLIDRFGSRRTMPVMLLLAALGALVFSTAGGSAALVAGRLLMGVGVAAIGMASIVACARWVGPHDFSAVTGFIIGLSQFGNLAATAPMAMVSAELGWRSAYYGMASVTLLLAALTYFVIKDAPADHAFHDRQPETFSEAFKGVREILAIPGLVRLLVIAGTAFAVISCLLGLWGGSYLHDVHGLETEARGAVLLYLAGGLIIGNMAYGFIDRRFLRRKLLVMASASVTVILLLVLAATPRPALWIVALSFAVIGTVGGYTIVIIAHGRTFYPDRLLGRGVTVVNTAVLGGAGLLQAITGALAGVIAPGATGMTPGAYQTIFSVLAGVLALALFVYRDCPELGISPSDLKEVSP